MRLPGFLRKRGVDPEHELKEVLGDYAVPSFSASVSRLLPMLRDKSSADADVAAALEQDPGLHVRVLRTVNSAAYGLSRKVSEVRRAVTLLGRARIEAIVLAVAVKDSLPRASVAGFEEQRYWQFAARRASAARGMARLLHPQTEGEAFTAGLLQDLGISVLVRAKGKAYQEIYERGSRDPETTLVQLERDELGYDHQRVGALIASQWELPEYYVRAIGCHHEGSEEEEQVDAAPRIVSLIRDCPEEWGRDSVVDACERRFGIQPETTLELLEQAFEGAEEFSKILA